MAYSKTKLLKYSGVALFFTTAFFASILTPTLIANNIGEGKVKDFCDEHKDLCNQDQTFDGNGNPTTSNLLSEVQEDSVVQSIVASIVGGWAVTFFLGLTVMLPMLIYTQCKKEQNANSARETDSLISTSNYTKSSNHCLRFLGKVKEYVLPTYWDTYLLTMVWASLSAGSIFIDWLNAATMEDTICESPSPQPTSDNPNPTYLCENFSENGDEHVQHEIRDLAGDVFDAMMWSGSVITLFTSLAFAGAIMTIYAGIKYCATRNENKQLNVNSQGDDGLNYNSFNI